MKSVRAIFRLVFFALAVGWLIIRVLWYNLWHGENLRRSLQIRQHWTRAFLPAIGIRIQTSGTPPDFPCILMSNHRSYLDPAILTVDVPGMPVSKAEVSRWPLIGYGARISGVFYLQRENLGSRKTTLNGIEAKVREGFSIILFPEGTTHAEPTTSPLRKGAFYLAAANGIPIVPVALEYGSADDYWFGNDSFLPHFIRRFGEKNMRVAVRYGPAIRNENPDELLAQTQTWIDAQIPDLRRELFW